MTNSAYDRLSAMDRSFLIFEGPNTHMHVGGTMIFEAGPLRTASGGIDVDRVRAYIGSRLHLVPRYRQRLAFVPIENAPVWVDDDHFNLGYHVRHTSLPRPGNERQLKQLCGQLMSQQLDRGKPLWEFWIVEGLEGGERFALVSKTHHCMVDGISGVDLLTALLRQTPDAVIEESPRWNRRRAPTTLQMLADAVKRRARIPFKVAQTLGGALQEPRRARRGFVETLSGVWQTVSVGLPPPADTPLNQPIGPHRRLDWLMLDLADVKAVKNQLGGTVNDVILATVAGAVRRFLQQRRVNVNALEWRTVIPVNTRRPEEHGPMGNRVSAWLIALPIHERDPRRRLARVREVTASLKQSKQANGVEALIQLGDWTNPAAVDLGVRIISWLHPYNLIVTNVPGPQQPLYLLGAQALEGYPLVPLFENQCLGVAVFSYIGKVCVGVNADWDRVPDLRRFIDALRVSFDELRKVPAICRGCGNPMQPSRVTCPVCGAASAPAAVPAPSTPPVPVAAAGRTFQALVVGDDPDLRRSVRVTLERADLGLSVITAQDGPEALALLDVVRPDVVILDLPTPGLDGLEVCRRLRADSRTASVPVVILTAPDNEESVSRGFRDGTDDYVVKPFRDEDLIARVSRVLERAYGRTAARGAASAATAAAVDLATDAA